MRSLLLAFVLPGSLGLLACGSGSGDGGDDGTTGGTDPTTAGQESSTGEIDNCTGGAPLPPPFCDHPTCYHDCGCEECTPDAVYCPDYDDTTMQSCSADGACVTPTTCAEGKHCIPLSPTEGRCSETYSCQELQDLYDVQIGKTSCAADEHCQVIAGPCASGLGACWHPVNQSAKIEVVDEIAANWADKSCGQDTCGGDCGAMPAVSCVDNVCTLQ